MANPVFADSAATGANDGTSKTDAFTNLQLALNDLDMFGTLFCRGTFLQTVNNIKGGVWELYGDLTVDANGITTADTYASTENQLYKSEDGSPYTLRFSGSTIGRDNMQCNGGIQTATTDITVWIADGDRGLFMSAAVTPSTVNFPRFKASGHTLQCLYTLGVAEVHMNLGEQGVDYSCQILDNFRTFFSNTNVASEALIFGGLIVGSEEDMIRTDGVSAHAVNIKESVIFGGPSDPKNFGQFMVQDPSGSVTFTDCRTYYPPYGTGNAGIDLRFDGAVTQVNPIIGVLPYNNFRRGGMVTVTTDDFENFEVFKQRNVVCEKFGLVQTYLLDRMNEITDQQWDDLNAAEAKGHLIANHTVHEAQLGSLDSIIFTGDPITIAGGLNLIP